MTYCITIIYSIQDEASDKCGNGTFEDVQYFSSEFGHGYFCPLKDVLPDMRFSNMDAPKSKPNKQFWKDFEHLELNNRMLMSTVQYVLCMIIILLIYNYILIRFHGYSSSTGSFRGIN